MNRKALVLLSGGLDSILATRLMLEQSIEIEALNFMAKVCMCGCKPGESPAGKAAKMLGVPLTVVDYTEKFLEIIRNPRYGYGSNMNPCIDCKINMLKAAKERMKEAGASFVVTGEVLGERPMSQRKDMLALIEKQSGLKGLLLRPLTAKLLEPTLPEKEGMVDREKLLDIRGRSRRPQIALAEKLGITEYPNPAGGCLLTDPGFARRIRDIMKHNAFNMDNLELLTVGRHFRLSDKAKLVVGRDENENALLEKMIKGGDICFRLMDGAGPVSILRGEADRALVESAAAIVAHHTKFKKENTVRMGCWKADAADHTVISVMPAAPEDVERIRL